MFLKIKFLIYGLYLIALSKLLDTGAIVLAHGGSCLHDRSVRDLAPTNSFVLPNLKTNSLRISFPFREEYTVQARSSVVGEGLAPPWPPSRER
jgi:hypothetical protein